MAVSKEIITTQERKTQIAAIDFGTSSVSLAYTAPNKGEVQVLKLEDDLSSRVSNDVFIQVIKATKKCFIKSIGSKAKSDYDQIQTKEQLQHKNLYFQSFKQFLDKKVRSGHGIP